jgi:hypothetical protein
VDDNGVDRCCVAPLAIVAARDTTDAISLIGRWRPAAVVIDADRSFLDLCGGMRRRTPNPRDRRARHDGVAARGRIGVACRATRSC